MLICHANIKKCCMYYMYYAVCSLGGNLDGNRTDRWIHLIGRDGSVGRGGGAVASSHVTGVL